MLNVRPSREGPENSKPSQERNMSTRSWFQVALPVLVAGAFALKSVSGAAEPTGAQDPMAALPAAVQRSVEPYVSAKTVERVKSERENGHAVFEIEYLDQGKKCSITVAERGNILEIERGGSPDDLPPEALEALKKKYPGNKIQRVESIERHLFEVKLDGGGASFELEVDALGRVTGGAPSSSSRDEDGDDDEEKDDE
jgi:uncharacterized membrane protein YkoI